MEDRRFYALFALALLAAFLFRFYDLTNRPIHHDEGVIGWFKENILNACLYPDLGGLAEYADRCGAAYNYHPDYHGPFEYLFGAWAFRLFGTSDFTLRAPECLFNLLTVALILPLRKKLGDAGSLSAAALLAVSPSFVYFAQRAYMDNFFLFFSLAFVVCAVRFWDERKNLWLYLGAADLALLFATKETAFIFLFTAASFAFFEYYYSQAKAGGVVARGREAVYGLYGIVSENRKAFLAGAALFAFVYAFVFSTMFADVLHGLAQGTLLADARAAFDYSRPDALFGNPYDDVFSGLSGGLTFWISRSTSWEGHIKPAGYYLWLLINYEPAVFALFSLALLAWGGIAARRFMGDGGAGLFRGRESVARFFAWWAASTLAIFALIPYKTPWLDVHMVLPMAIFAGLAVDELWNRAGGALKMGAMTAFAVLLLVSAFMAWDITYARYADGNVGLVYVSGLDDYKRLTAKIDAAAERFDGLDTEIAIVSTDQWPLAWSLRDYRRVVCWGGACASGLAAPIIVSSRTDYSEIREDARPSYYPPERFEMRPGAVVYLYVRR